MLQTIHDKHPADSLLFWSVSFCVCTTTYKKFYIKCDVDMSILEELKILDQSKTMLYK